MNLRITCIFFCLFLAACTIPMGGLFNSGSPHERYRSSLINAGLGTTELGRKWIGASENSIKNPVNVSVPYLEKGYFEAAYAEAVAFRFNMQKGRQLLIRLDKDPSTGFSVYVDLFEEKTDGTISRALLSSDTSGIQLNLETKETANYILRIQPELLKGGAYTISLMSGPSLGYPVMDGKTNHTQSYFGVARDGGKRTHEGIDMFAKKGTPAIAVADGYIGRVANGGLGGKTISLRPAGKNISVYYAHLDSQFVASGQAVKQGDTIGLIGNTGNARNTASHLHFGIYAGGGAIDPFPFIDPGTEDPESLKAPVSALNDTLRNNAETIVFALYPFSKNNSFKIAADQIFRVNAATSDHYRITLANGRSGYIKNHRLSKPEEFAKLVSVASGVPILEAPEKMSVVKTINSETRKLPVTGYSGEYILVRYSQKSEGWILMDEKK